MQEAASAAEGLAAIESRMPDLILLDVMMPQEMVSEIEERYGAGAIPVLMFSGQVADSREVQADTSVDLDELIDRAKAILSS